MPIRSLTTLSISWLRLDSFTSSPHRPMCRSHTHTLHTHYTHTPDDCSYAAATITHELTPEGTLAYFGTMMVGDKSGPKQTVQLPSFGKVDYTDDVAAGL